MSGNLDQETKRQDKGRFLLSMPVDGFLNYNVECIFRLTLQDMIYDFAHKYILLSTQFYTNSIFLSSTPLYYVISFTMDVRKAGFSSLSR